MIGGILRFDVKPEHREAFIQALVTHGRAAVPTEPGTLRFDVLVDQDDPNRVFSYEPGLWSAPRGAAAPGTTHVGDVTSGSVIRATVAQLRVC